jgi:hypothetical protein
MDTKKIQSILRNALEKEIPSSEIKLWTAIRASLVAGEKPFHQQGDKMNPISSRRVSRAALVTLTVGALMAVALITPRGRAFAQTVLQFFVRAEQDRYPLQAWQMTPPVQTTTESPFQLSVQEAESRAAYDVLSPVDVPAGMIFVGAGYDEKHHIVSQAFGQTVDYIELSLWQQPLAYYQPCGDIRELCENMLASNFVGASAYIEPVQISNGAAGEYLEGVWELTNDGPVWNPTPYSKMLRWQTDTMIFKLVYNGIDLTRDALVALAKSLR